MSASSFVTSDAETGMRHGGVRWPHGTIPTPFGCRRCGHPQPQHGRGYGHDWQRPTNAQILARMHARRRHLDEERQRFRVWKAFAIASGAYERTDHA